MFSHNCVVTQFTILQKKKFTSTCSDLWSKFEDYDLKKQEMEKLVTENQSKTDELESVKSELEEEKGKRSTCEVRLKVNLTRFNRAIAAVIADPTLQRRPAAAGELCIPQSSWLFSSSFFTLFPRIDIFFNTSIESVGTHERIEKIRVLKC